VKARWLATALLLWLALGFWATALDHPWQLMFESGGQFFSGVARVHLDKGLGFTRGHDWIFNEDNPYEWKGSVPLEARAYGHHPPAVGLSLAAVFAVFGQSRTAARGATIVSHLVSLLILLLAVPRWTRSRPSAAVFAGLVVVLVPMSGFFGRNVSHEAWLMPWVLLAVVAYVRRIERGGDGTRREDALVCAATAVACLYDWPGFYLPPVLVLFEAGRRRPLSRLNLWLVATTVGSAALALGHLLWAAPGGFELLVSGAQKRVDPAFFGFTWLDWLGRVRDFTVQTYTPAVLVAAGLAVVGWLVRAAARRSIAREPAAAFVAIWLAFAAIHIAAFPGGSWVHPYWMFYLMPAIAVSAGVAAATLWDARTPVLRWGLRVVVAAWLVEVLCAAHQILVWWLAVGAHPTGNPFIEWQPGSIPALLCVYSHAHGLTWPLALGADALRGLWGLAATHPAVAAGGALGASLLAWLLRGGPERPIARDAILLAGLGAFLLPITPEGTAYDAALRLASRLLAGAGSLPERVPWLEMFQHGDRFYFSYPPMTSVVLVPWVVATGGHGSQPLVNTLFILASAVLVHRLVGGLEGIGRWAVLAAIAYALGTPIVYSVGVGNVWLLMHSEANFFLLLALWLGFVRRAEAWAGFFLMTGAQCRYSVLLGGIAFAVRFLRESLAETEGGRFATLARRSLRFGLPMTIPLAVTLAFQWAAFGHPLTTAYTLSWNEWGPHGADFSIEYFVRNLKVYLFATPELLPAFPFVRFDPSGQAIWLMSPFFLGAWLPRLRLAWVGPFLGAAAAMMVFYCLYWWTGFAQYGTRYMQDLYPFLVPLAFAGLGRPGRTWGRTLAWLVALSIAINLYGAYVMLNVQR
jgi:Dolichyl-phosphate-mannose-protein mannosyltransferase